MTQDELNRWFVDMVLPLEGQLERFLRRNWRNADEVPDLRQEVYTRVYEGCAKQTPESAVGFVLTTARFLLIDKARRANVVSIEAYEDLEAVAPVLDELTPERYVAARAELKLVQAALNLLPRRCREVVELRKVEGFSQKEVAKLMGIAEDTVERQVSKGIRALAEALGREVGNGSSNAKGSDLASGRRKQ